MSPYEQYSEFMKRSRGAAKHLAGTYQRLEHLNQLARKTTIFDWEETSRELNDLVFVIKGDIKALSQQIEELRKFQITSISSSFKSQKSQNMESHSKTVILNLQQQLASMSSDFKTTLEIRSQNHEQQKARREKFSSPEAAHLLSRSQNNPMSNSLTAPSSSYSAPNSNSTTSSAIIDFGDPAPVPSLPSSHHQTQLLTYQDNNLQYLEERANAMQNVESTIVELGAIFNQLATMVQQQEEMITRIDTNVSDAALNVESAHQSLLQYFQSVSSNRWLMFKVFGVLFVFFLLFVVFAV